MTDDDPILARRAQVKRWVQLGKRIGYLGLLAAIVAFAIGFPTEFPSWTVVVAVAGLAVSCATLPFAVIFAYGINNAIRNDPGPPRRPGGSGTDPVHDSADATPRP